VKDYFLLVLITLCPGAACKTSKPDLKNFKTHAAAGTEFNYPGNWVLEINEASNASVFKIAAGSDQIAFILIFNDGRTTGLKEFAQDFSRDSTQATPIGQVSKPEFSKTVQSGAYETQSELFDINLIGMATKIKRQYRRLISRGHLIFIITQAPEIYWAGANPGFQLIADTFKFGN
jgi:hypothetical protein